MIVRTPAALAARRLARVVAMLWLRILRPAILVTEQKLHRNGHPRAGYSPSIGMTYRLQVPSAGRHDDRRFQLLLPPLLLAIDRPQLASGRVLQDLRPDQLRLGQREAHPAAVQRRRVAGHRVGPADDRHAPVLAGIGREVQGAMELVALHAHQRQQRPAAPGPA